MSTKPIESIPFGGKDFDVEKRIENPENKSDNSQITEEEKVD